MIRVTHLTSTFYTYIETKYMYIETKYTYIETKYTYVFNFVSSTDNSEESP